MENIDWKVGDECYCEFTLQKIHRVEPDGRVGDVTDGMFMHGSWDWREELFPVEPKVKEIADFVATKEEELRLVSFNGLNMPDIHWKYRDYFNKMCRIRDNDTAVEVLKTQLTNFTNTFIEQISKIRATHIDGIKMLRK